MTRHVFFSYAHADADRLLPFYNALQEQARPHHHLIWIDRGLVGGDLWENRIRLAIKDSYAVIFAVTKAFIERPFILDNEIPWAFDSFSAASGDTERLPIFPVLFDPLPSGWDKTHRSLKRLAEVQYLDGVGRDAEQVVQDLLRLIPTPPASTNFMVMWPRLSNFKGRREALDQLHQVLQAESSQAGITTAAALHGTGGVGKTQLAVEYAYQYQPDYPGGVFWVNASQDWQRELAALAEQMMMKPLDLNDSKRDKQLVLAFREYLRQRQANREAALIVLDNIEHPNSVEGREIAPKLTIDALCEETGTRLLLTTRVADLPPHYAALPVDVLLPDDALKVLLDAWQGSETPRHDTPDEESLQAIAHALGYLPLALGWIVAALRAMHDLTPAELLRELREGGIDEVVQALQTQDIKPGTPSYYAALVGKALAWQVAQLKNGNSTLLLALMAAYAEAAIIPRERLRLLSGLPESGLARHFTRAIKALQKFSLLATFNNGHMFQLHPLARDCVRQRLAVGDQLSQAAPRLAATYGTPDTLDEQMRERGFLAVYDDLAQTQAALESPNPDINTLEKLLRLEETSLLQLPAGAQPSYVVQQVRNRAFHEGNAALYMRYDQWLQGYAHFAATPESGYPASQVLLRTLRGREGSSVRGVLELGNGRLLSWGDGDTLRLWSAQRDELAVLRGHESAVYGILELGDGRLLSWAADRTLRLWSALGEALAILRGHEISVSGALELHDGRLLSWGYDGTLRLWTALGEALAVLRGHEIGVRGALELGDGRLLSWGDDGTLRLWTAQGRELAVLRGHEISVSGALELHDGRLLSWGDDDTLRLWSAQGSKQVILRGHQSAVHGTLELHDGRLLSWGDDDTLRLWSAQGSELTVLRGHEQSVSGALELGDGRLLSWAADRTLRLWSAEGVLLGVYGNDATITYCKLLKTGNIAIGDASGQVIVLSWNSRAG